MGAGRDAELLPEATAWVDRGSAEPLHRQVRRYVEAAVQRGTFPAGRTMPSSRYLAAALGVSRNTVTLALQDLVAQGLLTSRPRSGLVPTSMRSDVPARVRPVPAGRGPDWSDLILSPQDGPAVGVVLEPRYEQFDYPFLSGQIETRAFPTRAWLRAMATALDGPHIGWSTRDAATEDDPLLVQTIVEQVLPGRGITVQPDEVLVTNGAQQALHLLADALLDPGRTVLVEDPGYVDAARVFARTGARVALAPVDQHGLRFDRTLDVDLVFCTPSHQHPTNVTLDAGRRAALLAAAQERGFVVVEDDYDSEMRYRGAPTRPLKSADRTGHVVHLGTFSKFLAPGLRLGYLVASADLVADLRRRRYLQNRHTSGLLQRALALFIASGDYARALRDHRSRLRHKWELLDEALHEHLPWELPPAAAGGLSRWLDGPPELDASAAAARLRARGVLVGPGAAYYLSEPAPRNSLRIGLQAVPAQRIRPGVRLLCEELAAGLQRAGG